MDTHLKERLVGAAVLVAAAVILIPEMLSGPPAPVAQSPDVQRTDDSSVRTYTIDLGGQARSAGNASASSSNTNAEVIEEARTQPPEMPSVPSSAPPPEQVAAGPTSPAATQSPSTPTPASAPPSTAPVTREPPATPEPQRQQLPWAVQVGSFANQAAAERLSQDLKNRGYDSFVTPFRTGSQTLYRVRIGPMQERSAADAIVQKLKREGTGAAVVSNS